MLLPILSALLSGSLIAAAPARRPVKVTTYSSPREEDFGDRATEPARWRLPGSRLEHASLFAPGFASRDREDPKHPGIMGVGMEGGGWLAPRLHRGDAALEAALKAGYRALVLERWDEAARTATFLLMRSPVGGDDGAPLVEGVSAAVRAGNRVFPTGRRVRLYRDGVFFADRKIHDECSSCESDDHIDLFERLDGPVLGAGRWEAELLPEEPRR